MQSLPERYGPWALVAGASEGIGAAFATQLAQAGFSLVLIARREAPLEALAAALPLQPGREVRTVALDLGGPDTERALEALCAAHEIGLVVYNAALSVLAPFVETPLADKYTMVDVNVRGPLMAADIFGRAMVARGRGALVLLSSLTAFWGSAWLATYGATKAFNLSLGEALALELGPRGVDVVVCCAGATTTPGFLRAAAGRPHPPALSPEVVAAQTLARLSAGGAVIPGLFNRFATAVLRWMPRRWAMRIMARETYKLMRR